jgi:dihydroxy-acid dehydratase
MLPPDRLVKQGITLLPCVGDGRQSGTSPNPAILNASPEAVVGGGLALLRTGDRVRIDIGRRTADMLISKDELARRRAMWTPPKLVSQTPWQALQRMHTGQLETGACLDFAVAFQKIDETHGLPRTNH